MNKIHLKDINEMIFPTGRKTKVLIGADSPVKAEHFTLGHVVIEPGGLVPKHKHFQEEVYYIIEGKGEIELDNNIHNIEAGDAIYIESNVSHELVNIGDENMIMMFVYSPAGIVDHWDEERK